jgi:hypothetical protein
MSGKKFIEVLLHECWIGKCSVEHCFAKSTDRSLPAAIHR